MIDLIIMTKSEFFCGQKFKSEVKIKKSGGQLLTKKAN